jgi:lycopene beta-cyclase
MADDHERFDVAVLGAGCAGLAAGVELIKVMGSDRSLLLVDSRSSYDNDRTWCGWGVERHGFERAVAHVWPRCIVRHRGKEISIAPRRYRYRCIPGQNYYDLALKMLRHRAKLVLNEKVRSVSENATDVVVRTSRRVFRTRLVVDARWSMDSVKPPPGGMVQEFLGQRIRTKTPTFDPETVTLMDFDVERGEGVHFCYMLPFSEREALVEPTFLVRQSLPAEEYRSRIAIYLGERFGTRNYEVLAEERGCIPMGIARPGRADCNSRIVIAGTSGGLIKASSGYGFHAMQRHAKALAKAWARDHWDAVPFPRSSAARLLDTVFANFLCDHPERAPEVLYRLFERVDPDRLARFLSDAAELGDYAAVVRAVPAQPMLRRLTQLAIDSRRERAP